MPLFYRGAGVDTYWHMNDARLTGFVAQSPGTLASINRIIAHIRYGTITTPYISLTRAYGVAKYYAQFMGRNWPTRLNPAYVYEIELDEPIPTALQLIDPVKEITSAAPDPTSIISYQHDGHPDFLLGVVDSYALGHHLIAPIAQPPASGATQRAATLSSILEALVKALRDAEILALGNIPSACIRHRFKVW